MCHWNVQLGSCFRSLFVKSYKINIDLGCLRLPLFCFQPAMKREKNLCHVIMVEYQKMCHTLVLSKIVKFLRDIFSNCTHCCNPLFFEIFQNLVIKACHHGTLIPLKKSFFFFTQNEKEKNWGATSDKKLIS